MQVQNSKIRDIHGALLALADRRLGETANVKRVVTLLRRHFDPAKKILDDLYADVIKNHPTPEGWEDRNLPVAVFEAREFEFRKLMDETQEIPDIPENLMLSDKDMPKFMKGEAGDTNQTSLGTVIHNLYFLYPLEGDEKPVKDGEDGTGGVVKGTEV